MKRTMIKLLAVFAVSSLFFASCKEDNPLSGGDQEALNVAKSPRVSFFVPVNFWSVGPKFDRTGQLFTIFYATFAFDTLLDQRMRTY